jgi:hypothetical protein
MEERLCQTRLRLEDGQLVAEEARDIFEAQLFLKDGQLLATIPKLAQDGQSFKIASLAESPNEILLEVWASDLKKLGLKIIDPVSLKLARGLTLESLIVTKRLLS